MNLSVICLTDESLPGAAIFNANPPAAFLSRWLQPTFDLGQYALMPTEVGTTKHSHPHVTQTSFLQLTQNSLRVQMRDQILRLNGHFGFLQLQLCSVEREKRRVGTEQQSFRRKTL